MRYRRLGSTGLNVSEVSLGTVQLGMDYGFPGTDHHKNPDEKSAIRLLHRAVDLGINLFDTHRDYGASEEIIGKALAGMTDRPHIASKVTIPPDPEYSGPFPPPPDRSMGPKQLRRAILGSIEASLQALRLETIDLMQIHNTTPQCLQREDVLLSLEDARRQGKVRFLGASAYGETMPFEVMKRDAFQALQVPFNLLDQGLADRVFPRAARENIGIVVRSVFLKGALTTQIGNVLPQKLVPLHERALEALKLLGEERSKLAQVALRFCLSFSAISTLLMGVRSIAELESNLATVELGPFPPDVVEELREFSMDDVDLVRPTRWGWT